MEHNFENQGGILPDPKGLARKYVKRAANEIDSILIPKALPLILLSEDTIYRNAIAEIGVDYFSSGHAAKASQIRSAKGAYSYRLHTKPSHSTQIAFDLFAREFAMLCPKQLAHFSYSMKFSDELPNRLFPERSAAKRDRWVQFEEQRKSLLRQVAIRPQKMYAMTADIARFFDGCDRDELYRAMNLIFPSQKSRISSFATFLGEIMGSNRGLPASTSSSFFFADLLLCHCDSEAKGQASQLLRWSDEYWWFSKYPSHLEDAYRKALGAISRLGLHFNESKTRIVDAEKELYDESDYQRIKDTYFQQFKTASVEVKAGYICGVVSERVAAGIRYDRTDRFLLNRLRDLFLRDREAAAVAEAAVLRVFEVSYGVSKDALLRWIGILLMLPTRTKVIEAANRAFKEGKYPLDSDRALLMDLMAVDGAVYGNISMSSLVAIIEDPSRCSTVRGSALRLYGSLNPSLDLLSEFARPHRGDRVLREYVAATALSNSTAKGVEIVEKMKKQPIDQEEMEYMSAILRLFVPLQDRRVNFLLPSDPILIRQQLTLARNGDY